jgi:hypothetical protein
MSKANEFQIYANECLAWAEAADTQEKRKQFLKLAGTWMHAAVQEDRGNAFRGGLDEMTTRDSGRGNGIDADITLDPLKLPKAADWTRDETHRLPNRFSLRNVRLGQVQIWLFMTVIVFVVGILLFGIPAP